MANKYPGKRHSDKNTADMTPQELTERRTYLAAAGRYYKTQLTEEQKAARRKYNNNRAVLPIPAARRAAYAKKRLQLHPEYYREYAKKGVRDLSKTYIKQLLSTQIGVPFGVIPNKLIELKRAQIKLRRMAND